MKDFLSDQKLRNNPYSVPEGYFDELSERMLTAAREGSTHRLRHFTPYAALAAAMLVMLSVGSLLIKRTLIQEDSANLENLTAYFDLSSLSETDPVYFSSSSDMELTDEDIIDYLILTGTSEETVHELTQQQ